MGAFGAAGEGDRKTAGEGPIARVSLSKIRALSDKRHVPPTNSTDTVKLEVVETEAEVVSDLAQRPSAALAEDMKRAKEYLRHTKADSTLLAYESAWKRFQEWATSRGVTALPATPEVVCLHLGWLAAEGYGASIIAGFLSAAGHYHQEAHFDFPRNAQLVTKTLRGIHQQIGKKHVKKAPLELGALTEVCRRLQDGAEGLSGVERALRLRQRAMVTVGWFCMLRSANLVAIRRGHVRFVRFEGDVPIDDDGSSEGFVLHLPKSKTDQLQEGRNVAVHAQSNPIVCPVRALFEYLRENRFTSEDLIFPVSERTVTRLVKRLVANPAHGHRSLREIDQCEACAESVRRFGSHSLRRGMATSLARKGISEREIMRHGGWKNERVMRGYIEDATLFEDNPTKNLTGETPAPTPVKKTAELSVKKSRRRRRRRRSLFTRER